MILRIALLLVVLLVLPALYIDRTFVLEALYTHTERI